MAFESIVGFFVGCVKTIWRRGNVIHHKNKALRGQKGRVSSVKVSEKLHNTSLKLYLMYASKDWDSAVDKSQTVDKSQKWVDKSQQPYNNTVRRAETYC